ncbi:hypothetical protein BATDEDRAFT_37336 [Batrachochytrium dendrobatidis JAM81]|uniref:W2 domain-containing protein n=2 Tax=Batrachochytrium dendrobatidis TaxID=109871 RepID=F4PA63_BATDJ|nr:uncharacterized protein BATDEDRAFT_37336 [Batrachochytrium dendrobatidis JAM81]EGF77983.1 hypothetical protein BATDEDRAFT_37336 [Batrachochytrium dendrobatidis JAM81]KAJ8330199.1 hypothetical protein O5D80_001768 [Batrachochytrium dendrobatidis]KAK5670383.1 hypothetical protein QVD99_003072 [Batrachochytrium dendrobatidis]OAJ43996.1 hypothetical protein BDEG_27298 [Batrachochytrium dendrobatidis JEL423]|eukprot:XP_006681471.1 hypothetical protein BATDEDRAFT_37336 [Batrachochytrium dendrobatidis JAM81]
MNFAQQPSPAPQQKPQQQPPQGQFKLKQRKREAVQKYEPEVFREQFLALIPTESTEIDHYAEVIEANDAKLDIKRYAEAFFELFLTGGLVAPGGVIELGDHPNPFSIFAATTTAEVKARANILTKLARRLKYIPRKLEETLSHLLQYIHKFGDDADKLATSVGILTANGTLPLTVLGNTVKEHIVNDGKTLRFLTIALEAYIQEQSMDHLITAMRKSGMDAKMPEFFPESKRKDRDMAEHFENAKLNKIADFLVKQKQAVVKEMTRQGLKDLFAASHTADAAASAKIATHIKQLMAVNKWNEQETMAIVWDGLMDSVDWSSRGDQIETLAIKTVTLWSPLLVQFCTSPKTEIALLTKIQVYFHNESRLMKHYRAVVQNLYKHDVVSESGILYWFEKGVAPQGKTVFLKQMEPFVNWLKEADEDDSDEE